MTAAHRDTVEGRGDRAARRLTGAPGGAGGEPGVGGGHRAAGGIELGAYLGGRLPGAAPTDRERERPLRVDDQGRLPGRSDREIPPEAIAGSLVRGKVGADVTAEQAREAARLTGLFLLSTLRAELGSLDRVTSVLKVFGMVNCAPGFTATPAVIDGCSDLLVRVFGRETGAHARSAIGVAELPFDICVEIEMIVAAG
ncbi:RidA family protein [Actinoplanes auranticolor]|uniref:Endoribonuclease L-PSP/chorismate mutase-like domain-containing protein n=1 Tax=Actinoplanes auranticolor TaxID=47988 RepID=A0A919VJ78_9ACTN|nr:RidA family protein [Actinoplanes auranticolor]GIM64169.1 hypothetical protein Aau02nite_08760 [Actinoplanes auranticolor]